MSITQKSRMQVRQGKIDELPQLAGGEFGWAIDTRQLFVGNGLPGDGAPVAGNTEILTAFSSLVRNPITNTLTVEVTQPGHAFVAGTPVYFDGAEWQPADAADELTYAIGVINNVEGPQFNVILYGITDLGGFTPGAYYYTSDTAAGTLTTTAPDNKNLVLFGLDNSRVIVVPSLGTGGEAYVRPAPMSISVGGAVGGTTFSGSVQDALDLILYPYIPPVFTSFQVTNFPAASPLEVGTIIPAPTNYTFTWTNTNPENITLNSIVIEDISGNSFPLVSVAGNTGSQSIAFVNNVQRTSAGTHTWRITGDGIASGNFTREFSMSWQWRIFYGSSALTVLNEAQIEAFSSGLQATPNATYSFNTPGYKYIAYPAAPFGPRTLFRDTASGFGVSMQAPFTVLITNSAGVAETYNVYRTTNQLTGNINIAIIS